MCSAKSLPKGAEDMSYEMPIIYHDLILRLWRLYLEVHFQHSEEDIFEKLDIFKVRVTENRDDIIFSRWLLMGTSEWDGAEN